MIGNERFSRDAQLISDVLQVLPIMSEIHELATSLKGKEITENDKRQLYQLSRELRAKSAKVGLLPTVEDELKGVDIGIVRDRFIRLVEELLPDAQVEVLEGEGEG